MAQTTVVDTKIMNTILSKLDGLKRDITAIKAKLDMDEPRYGSDEWWDWSEKKAQEDIKAGRVYGPYKTTKEAITALHTLQVDD